MKKILAFCFFPAFTPPSNGGQSRLFNFYKSLSRWHQVTLLTSSHMGVEEETINHGANFIERRIPKDYHFSEQWRNLEQYSSGGDLSGPAIAASSRFATPLHQAYLEEYEDADVIVHDFPFTEGYDLFKGVDDKLRVYNAHNCEAMLYRKLHPSKKSKFIHDLVSLSEESMLGSADLVFYCNEDDLAAFREASPEAKFAAHYAANGMSLQPFNQFNGGLRSAKPIAVFMGSAHPPNIAAARFIVDVLAPKFPDVCFQIIGSCLPEGLYSLNVERLGVVSEDHKSKLLRTADIALNPMEEGSGSNVKVLDYFSYSLPVLSTKFGMRGISAEAGVTFIEAPLDEFALTLDVLLSDHSRLRRIGEAGQCLAAELYTWDVVAKGAAEKISDILETRSLDGLGKYVLCLNDYDSFDGIGGGATRTRGLYSAISEWSPVVFICFSNNGQFTVRKHAKNISVITIPKSLKHEEDQSRFNSLFHVSSNDIVASMHCMQNKILYTIYKLLRKKASAIVLEHCYMVPIPLLYGDQFIYSSQNVELELKLHMLKQHPLSDELIAQVKKLECQAVECATAIIAVSDEDAHNLVKGRRTAGQVIVIRNGAEEPPNVRLMDTELKIVEKRVGKNSVVFIGSAHIPNIDSAMIIVEQVAPACPDVEFHLIGSVCGALNMMTPKNVYLWGVLDELTKSAVMQSCQIAINPMISGGGSNIKLADYIGNGLFVVTTEFGQRGYPNSIHDHILVAEIKDFPDAIRTALGNPKFLAPAARTNRVDIFYDQLSMKSLGKRFLSLLQDLSKPKKRVLFVTYRYTAPAMGGAEMHIEHLVRALGDDGKYLVDIVSPEVSNIKSNWRFHEIYKCNDYMGAFIGVPNLRFARFPVNEHDEPKTAMQLNKHWRAQSIFERELNQQIEGEYKVSGITWGWAHPDVSGGQGHRWGMTSCGFYSAVKGPIRIKGFAPSSADVICQDKNGLLLKSATIEGQFTIEFNLLEAGSVALFISISQVPLAEDPRPLGFYVFELNLSGTAVDLALPTLIEQTIQDQDSRKVFDILNSAAEKTRFPLNVNLTDSRGPWSDCLERYIAENVAKYDLVVTHNNIFRPAVVAIKEANRCSVPVILIPHAHLDDDYYHFPDVLESARSADLVLAAPKIACDFFASHGCNVQYHASGIDVSESYSTTDIQAFRRIFPLEQPFVLVLGRKAMAKGYLSVISAIEKVNLEWGDVHVVLIGPDDDGVVIDSRVATYLGHQSREVLRGALQACVALVNMSASESFGIVLLEAWMAGKPVVVNKNCAAFHDMAIDNENALMVNSEQLATAIMFLLDNPNECRRLAENGAKVALNFDWKKVVSETFLNHCEDLISDSERQVTFK